MALIDAYDKRTGKKLSHRVPEHFIDHPVLGANLSKTPRQKAADTRKAASAATPKAPAAGDTEKE